MLNRAIAVLNEAHIHVIKRAAFRDDQYVIVMGRFYDLLALIAARLVIVFNAVCALIFKSRNMFLRIFFFLDIRKEAGRFSTVNDFARGICARREEFPSALHLGSGKDFGGAA